MSDKKFTGVVHTFYDKCVKRSGSNGVFKRHSHAIEKNKLNRQRLQFVSQVRKESVRCKEDREFFCTQIFVCHRIDIESFF
jgi:hypothetical protein